MAYCDVLQAAKTRAVDELAAQHHRDLTAARDKLLSEASQRRSEYADATARLQDENSALRSRVSQLELETSSKSLEAERNTLQRKLGEVELSWSQLLAAKETSWAQDRAMAVESKERLEAQHKQLRSVVLDLEATLRRVVTEKEQVEDALAAETQRSDDSRELARSRSETAAALREVDRLRKEVESLENCAVQREKVFEEKTLELQREVENERQRNNGVVAMYARQVEALEQQLTAAMSKNRVLVTELQKERRQQLQETLK
jgi:hypothetical protein